MRIAYVITRSDTIGGAHVHVRDLVRVLLDQGHDAKVFVGNEGPFTCMLTEARVPCHPLKHLKRPINPYRDILAIKELRNELKAFAPDLVACHSSKAGWLGRIVAKTLGIPVIFTAHGWAFAQGVPRVKRTIYRLAERLATPLASRIIAVSESDRQLAIQSRVAAPKKVVTVWNGIPEAAVPPVLHRSSLSVRLIMVARLDAQKSHKVLFYALAQIRNLDWTLDVVGDGPLEAVLQKLSDCLGLKDRINFLGLRKDVSTCLAQGQVFLLISNWEGLPLSILEAMQRGLPVIATDVGGVGEAVIHEKTGFLVRPGDVAGLGGYIANLIKNESLRSSMGRAGRLRYEEYFTIEKMVGKTLAVYKDVLEGKP